jgi:DNA-directed RNA polymerase subunit M/transcription elongation factor TFIIS
MQIVTNADSFRELMKTHLNKYFNDEKTASNLEKGIYNWTIKQANNKKVVKKWDNPYFVQIYKDKFKSVVSNLKTTNLIDQVANNEIKVHQIAFMSHYEMNPEKWSTIIETQMKINKSKYESQVEASTDVFTCRKCKGNRCTYVAQQIRSSDEPMTIFVTCLDCGKKWKC